MNTLTVKEASQLSGISELKIRHWLIERLVPWGNAVKFEGSSRYSYTIFEKPFQKWLESGGEQ